ncbi:hypothetical protein ACFWG4_47420, partial [Rhodococcus wratislaviensis]
MATFVGYDTPVRCGTASYTIFMDATHPGRSWGPAGPPVSASSVVAEERGRGGVPAAQARRTDLAARRATTRMAAAGEGPVGQSSSTANDQHHPASSRAMAVLAS